jgi:hypothetical protein
MVDSIIPKDSLTFEFELIATKFSIALAARRAATTATFVGAGKKT